MFTALRVLGKDAVLVEFSGEDHGISGSFEALVEHREIMLSSHTVASLSLEQEFLVPQSTCPDGAADGVGYAIVGKSLEEQTIARSAKRCPTGRIMICCDHGLGVGTLKP